MKITGTWKQYSKTSKWKILAKENNICSEENSSTPELSTGTHIYSIGKSAVQNSWWSLQWRKYRSINSGGNKIGDSVERGRTSLPFTPMSQSMHNVHLHARDGRYRWVMVVTRWSSALRSSVVCDERFFMLGGVTPVTRMWRPSLFQKSKLCIFLFFFSLFIV